MTDAAGNTYTEIGPEPDWDSVVFPVVLEAKYKAKVQGTTEVQRQRKGDKKAARKTTTIPKLHETRKELTNLPISQLKAKARYHGVSLEACLEKSDIVEVLLRVAAGGAAVRA